LYSPTTSASNSCSNSLIFCLVTQFYRLAARVLEGGFTSDGRFLLLPIHGTRKLTEAFRRTLMKLLLSKGLISEDSSSTLLCWKDSGFSIDQRLHCGAQDHAARIALAQYIARAPLSLAKLTYLPADATLRCCSDFNPILGDSIKIWSVRDFIAEGPGSFSCRTNA
jgi:hypothetical protein